MNTLAISLGLRSFTPPPMSGKTTHICIGSAATVPKSAYLRKGTDTKNSKSRMELIQAQIIDCINENESATVRMMHAYLADHDNLTSEEAIRKNCRRMIADGVIDK